MSTKHNFDFKEDAALLKSQARKFLDGKFPSKKLHQLVAGDHDPLRDGVCAWNSSLWREIVALGWSAVAVPESAGGAGMPGAAVAGLVEEFGRAALPCPLLGTINASYVLAKCGDGGHAALAEIAAGCAASLAITPRCGSWNPQHSEVSFADGKLNGSAWFVQDAGKVERLLVSASVRDGLGLFWVPVDAPGVSVKPDAIVDLTRDQAHVEFCNVAAELITLDGVAALDAAFPAIWCMLGADIAGAAEWQLQTTVEYVTTRVQFDHPLGFFQAVKHPLVDLMLKVDETRSLVYYAASTLDESTSVAQEAAHMAKASASETASFAASRTVQLHGGIGFTWECYIHLYFKRQKHSQMLWGDARWHRKSLANILIDKQAA